MKDTIGKRIAKLRKEKGLTQKQLAEKLMISDKTISKWEGERGNPSMEFLPKLSELFSVGVDYLITGNKKYQNMEISDIENCAIKDNLKVLEKLKDEYKESDIDIWHHKDKKGKTLFKYVLEYEKHTLFNYYFDKEKDIKEVNDLKDIEGKYLILLYRNACKFGRVDLLEKFKIKLFKIENSKYVCPTDYPNSKNSSFFAKSLSKEELFATVNDLELPKKTIDYLIDIEKISKDDPSTVWTISYKYFIDKAVRDNNLKLLEKLITNGEKINKIILNIKADKNFTTPTAKFIKSLDKGNNDPLYNLGRLNGRYEREIKFHFVTVLEETLRYTFDKKRYELLDKLNKINLSLNKRLFDKVHNKNKLPVINKEQIHDKKVDSSKKESAIKKMERKATYKKILNIDKTLEYKDYEFAKRMFEKHPIHPYEVFFKYVDEEDYKTLFRFAVDKEEKLIKANLDSAVRWEILNRKNSGNIGPSKNTVVEDEEFLIEKEKVLSDSELTRTVAGTDLSRKYRSLYLKIINNINNTDKFADELKKNIISEEILGDYNPNSIYFDSNFFKKGYGGYSLAEDVIKKIENLKIEILRNFFFKIKKEELTGDITKDYLEELFSSEREESFDILIIKLYVKLESIFKYNMGYEGDFNNMLKKYSNERIDEEGYHDESTSLFNKLKSVRNQIVHPNDQKIDITKEEIRKCIDLIVRMDGGK